MACHSRTISGPWLAAKAPAKLATAQPLGELGVQHADGEEVVAEQVGVGALRQERRIVVEDGLADFGRQGIPREHGIPVGLELPRDCWRLEVEEKLRQPVVAHGYCQKRNVRLAARSALPPSSALSSSGRVRPAGSSFGSSEVAIIVIT